MFLLSLVSELYYLITNISFINFRNIPFYFFNNKVSKIYKNKLFFFIKFNYLLSIINSFFFLEHSFKIWNSLIFIIASSLNFFFSKLNFASFFVFPIISSDTVQALFVPKFLYFFQISEEKLNMQFAVKYFFVSLASVNVCFKLSILVNKFNFFNSYEDMLFFFFFDIFSDKKLYFCIPDSEEDGFRYIYS